MGIPSNSDVVTTQVCKAIEAFLENNEIVKKSPKIDSRSDVDRETMEKSMC